jgi:pyruvate dehydrogenase (quinone)
MASTVGDFFWERLHAWGVRVVFGYPGDGINGLLGAVITSKRSIFKVPSRMWLGHSYSRRASPPKCVIS